MQVSQILTGAIEAASNQALKWSSNSEMVLRPLVDKVCIIYLQELQSALLFRFNQHGVIVGADADNLYASMPDEEGENALSHNECWVSISLFALDKLKQNNQMTKLIKSGKLDFAGDLGILQAVSKLFDKIDIDFEEVLSTYIGDAPAYQVNTSAKKIASSLYDQLKMLTQDIATTALDEKPIGVRPILVMNFNDEVNQIRADVDRLEARLANFEAKQSEKSKGNAQ